MLHHKPLMKIAQGPGRVHFLVLQQENGLRLKPVRPLVVVIPRWPTRLVLLRSLNRPGMDCPKFQFFRQRFGICRLIALERLAPLAARSKTAVQFFSLMMAPDGKSARQN